jgi:hypothetical protein
MFAVAASLAGLSWPTTGDASLATHEIVMQAAREHGVPEVDADFLASRIDEIERSPKAPVSFDAMSPWRRERFEHALRSWATSFPQAAGRSDSINRGHAWSTIQVIAPLFVVPPRVTDPADAAAIERQVAEVRDLISTVLGPVLRAHFETVAKSENPATGSLLSPDEIDAFCDQTIDEAFSGIVLSRDDDLNPGPRHPVPEAEWPKVLRAAEAAFARIAIPAGRPIRQDLIDALRQAEAAGDAEKRRELFEFLRQQAAWEVDAVLHSNDSALSVLSKAYAATATAKEAREYRSHAKVLESMVDRDAIEVGEKDRWALAEANEKRWFEERRKNFEDVVARSPQALERTAPPEATGRRLSPYIVVNGLLVCVLAAAYWIRRLVRRG